MTATTSTAGPAAPVTSFTYDSLDRVASITNPEGGTVQYEYYAGGAVKKATYPNGSFRTLTPVDMQGVVDLTVTGYDASHLAPLIAPSAAVAVHTLLHFVSTADCMTGSEVSRL